jgi:hypothetical protein
MASVAAGHHVMSQLYIALFKSSRRLLQNQFFSSETPPLELVDKQKLSVSISHEQLVAILCPGAIAYPIVTRYFRGLPSTPKREAKTI